MPPKSDPNRAGRETSDFPSVCEPCLGPNPYIQMVRDALGAECKICTRPFTVFRWSIDRTARTKKTNICLTCARLKNCCQSCMLDLSFGLPIAIRDAALKLVTQGPNSDINKQYYAQNNEGALQGGDVPEEYEKTEEKARGLLRRLAQSEPYRKRQEGGDGQGQKRLMGGAGPVRSRGRGGQGAGRGGRFPGTGQLPPGPQDYAPPDDTSITSLFLTGVEDDLAEHHIRTFFSAFGAIRSIVCVHRSRCAFVNFATRAGAEAAAESCQGKALIAGCPLRIQWGKPRPLGNTERGVPVVQRQEETGREEEVTEQQEEVEEEELVIPRPPGAEDEIMYSAQTAV